MEGGLSHVAGPVVQTGVGRTQITDVKRPWARFNLNVNHTNVFVAYTGRDAPGQLSLASGTNSTLTSHTVQFEGQTNRSFKQNRIQVVVGASAVVERIDSFDEGLQRQSLLFEPVGSDQQAVFGQVDWNAVGGLRLVLAGRGDFSSLHDFQFSPKGSAVYAIAPSHSVRFTYNEAFQVPNYSEFFLQADAAAPVDLSGLNAFCTPFGADCRFGPTRVLALGNKDLELEKIRTLEAGYTGLIAGRALMTADYYRSRASNFITDLLPQVSARLGRINPNFGPWQAPAGLPPAVADQVRAAAPAILSNNIDGSNILAAVSYTNFGRVDTQGIDLGFNYALPAGWRGSFAYSWFDFTVHNPEPGFEAMVLPNSPEHTVAGAHGLRARPVRHRFRSSLGRCLQVVSGPVSGSCRIVRHFGSHGELQAASRADGRASTSRTCSIARTGRRLAATSSADVPSSASVIYGETPKKSTSCASAFGLSSVVHSFEIVVFSSSDKCHGSVPVPRKRKTTCLICTRLASGRSFVVPPFRKQLQFELWPGRPDSTSIHSTRSTAAPQARQASSCDPRGVLPFPPQCESGPPGFWCGRAPGKRGITDLRNSTAVNVPEPS